MRVHLSLRVLAMIVFLITISGCGSGQSPDPTAAIEPVVTRTLGPSSTPANLPATLVPLTTTPPATLLPSAMAESTAAAQAPDLSYRLINSYPHDPQAFTEGLVIHEGELYETTGLNGQSTIRRVDLESGEILQSSSLTEEYFGEGLAIIDQKMIWVTWKSNTGFVFDLHTFEVIDQFSYDHEGWGLAYDGSRLYLSDGTDTIHILDPETYAEMDTIQVQDAGQPITMINELEFMDGRLYANIWLTDLIAEIDPLSGRVTGWLDLSQLTEEAASRGQPIDVLNGIAYDVDTGQLFVTGKYWPKLFEIEVFSSVQPDKQE